MREIKYWLWRLVGRNYFHLMPQRLIQKMVDDGKTWGYILNNFRQPEWCDYPSALEGQMGCWSLTDLSGVGGRVKISKKFCSGCDSCTLNSKPTA